MSTLDSHVNSPMQEAEEYWLKCGLLRQLPQIQVLALPVLELAGLDLVASSQFSHM